jgi:hypothetical protein
VDSSCHQCKHWWLPLFSPLWEKMHIKSLLACQEHRYPVGVSVFLFYRDLNPSKRNCPADSSCHQCKHWWLPLFSPLWEKIIVQLGQARYTLHQPQLHSRSQSYRLHPEIKGLSPGLKNMPPACFLPAPRCRPPSSSPTLTYQNKKDILTDVLFILVGEAGLEPARPQ